MQRPTWLWLPPILQTRTLYPELLDYATTLGACYVNEQNLKEKKDWMQGTKNLRAIQPYQGFTATCLSISGPSHLLGTG